MNKYLMVCCAWLLPLLSMAQQKPDMKQYEKQLKQVQQRIDSLKRANPEVANAMKDYNKNKAANQKYADSVADANGAKRMELPDIDKYANAGMPDIDKLQADQAKRMQQLQQVKGNMAAANKAALPQSKGNLPSIVATSNNYVKTWATAMLAKAKQQLGTVLCYQLEQQYKDSTKNAAAIGMLLVANGMPKYVGQYFVCRTLQDRPNNMDAINDLGIFFRYEKDYTKALQCFHLAKQLNDSSYAVTANLGWAYAYYGDFNKAKQYLNEALKLQPDLGTAMEGLALVAYQQGNKGALWDMLAKQMLQYNRTGGYSGTPSGQMASFCGGVMTEDEMNRMDKGGNSSTKNTALDNKGSIDEENQGDEIIIKASDAIDMFQSYAMDFDADFTAERSKKCMDKISKAIQNDINYVYSLSARLPIPKETKDANGNIEKHIDYGQDPHYLFFHQQHLEFQKRRTKVYADCGNKLAASFQAMSRTYSAEMQSLVTTIKGCKDESCVEAAKCEWYPKLAATLKSGIMSIGDIFTTAKSQMENEAWDYRQSSSDMIRFIPQKDWNEYMNAIREADIRMGFLLIMELYQNITAPVQAMKMSAEGIAAELTCFTPIRLDGVSIANPRMKKLKTFAGPCYKEATEINFGIGKYIDNCDRTRFEINGPSKSVSATNGPSKFEAEVESKLFFEKVYSKKFKEDDYYRGGLELHAKASYDYAGKDKGDFGLLKVKASAGVHASGEITVTAFQAWDANGSPMKKGFSYSGNASVSGDANVNLAIGKNNTDLIKNSFERGMAFDGEISAIYGADGQLGNYNFRNTNITTSSSTK